MLQQVTADQSIVLFDRTEPIECAEVHNVEAQRQADRRRGARQRRSHWNRNLIALLVVRSSGLLGFPPSLSRWQLEKRTKPFWSLLPLRTPSHPSNGLVSNKSATH